MPTSAQLTIDTPDGPMPAYAASPDTAARGGILVVQEAFGVTTHIQAIADRLAAAGWYAVAPALFHRQGSPVFAYDDLDSVMPAMGQLTAEAIAVDIAAALDHLEQAGFTAERSGVVGFCMGGTVSLYAGTTRPLGAAVTFYGGGLAQGRLGMPPLIEQAPNLRAAWLGLFGDLDRSIPVEEVEQLRLAAAKAPVATDIVRYPDADHGFNCNDRPAVFNATAAADAWRRTLSWFDEHLAGEDV